MPDIYLQMMMHGELRNGGNKASQITPKKDKFQIAEDKFLDDLIAKSSLLDDPQQNKLIPASIRKAKLKEDFRESAKCIDFSENLVTVQIPPLSINGAPAPFMERGGI